MPDMQQYLRLVRFSKARRRRAAARLANKVLHDEQGGEVLEYALVAGLIVTACIAVVGCVGTKVLAKWSSLNSKI